MEELKRYPVHWDLLTNFEVEVPYSSPYHAYAHIPVVRWIMHVHLSDFHFKWRFVSLHCWSLQVGTVFKINVQIFSRAMFLHGPQINVGEITMVGSQTLDISNKAENAGIVMGQEASGAKN